MERHEERDRFRHLRESGDSAEKDALVQEYLWVASHAARRFAGRGESTDDLVQVASLALVKAVDRFDPERGLRFTTFAMPTVLGELRRHFRDRGWSVRVGRRVKDLHLDVRGASDRLTQQLGRHPSVSEVANDLDVDDEQVLEAVEAGAAYRSVSLDAPPKADDGTARQELGATATEDEALEALPERVALLDSLSRLPRRDRKVVYLRFYRGLTQAEIAAEVDVSQVHVSRILRASLAWLEDDLQREYA